MLIKLVFYPMPLLAERFNAGNGRIARIILLPITLAFFTFLGRWRCWFDTEDS